jgi:hypothetical protein
MQGSHLLVGGMGGWTVLPEERVCIVPVTGKKKKKNFPECDQG